MVPVAVFILVILVNCGYLVSQLWDYSQGIGILPILLIRILICVFFLFVLIAFAFIIGSFLKNDDVRMEVAIRTKGVR